MTILIPQREAQSNLICSIVAFFTGSITEEDVLQLKSQQIASLVKFILGKKFSPLREKLQEKIPQILEITKI